MKRSLLFISVLLFLVFTGGALGQSERNKHRLLVLTDIGGDPKTGGSIHILLEVTDNGDPPLTHYRRMIIHVSA